MAETIDAHHHLWRYTPEEYGWISEEMKALQRDFLTGDLEASMRAAGVDGTVAVQARQSLAETRWLLDLASGSGAIRGVVGWVPLAGPSIKQTLQEFSGAQKLKGVRHVLQDEADEAFMLRDGFNAGVSCLADAGLVYDILIKHRQLPQAVKFVKMHPGQSFVLDHLAKPNVRAGEIAPWREGLMRLAELETVRCKLSGLITEADWQSWTLEEIAPYLDTALEAFGADRLMAGSDWPVCLLASSYQGWWATLRMWAAALTPSQQDAIFGQTAQRVYRLADV